MSSAHNASKPASSAATSNSIQLEWICSIFRTSASVSSSIDRTWIADAPIVLQGRCEHQNPFFFAHFPKIALNAERTQVRGSQVDQLREMPSLIENLGIRGWPPDRCETVAESGE